MKRTATTLLTCLVLLAAAPACGDDVADIDDLIGTDKRMQRAFIDRNVEALEKIFTDDYYIVLGDGSERTKRDFIERVRSRTTVWEVNETTGWQVKVHGDVGVIVGTLHQKGRDHGARFDNNVKFSDTYVRENGLWRLLHSHAAWSVETKDTPGN